MLHAFTTVASWYLIYTQRKESGMTYAEYAAVLVAFCVGFVYFWRVFANAFFAPQTIADYISHTIVSVCGGAFGVVVMGIIATVSAAIVCKRLLI